MINILDSFEKIIDNLKVLKDKNIIDKYIISLDQRNEIFILIVTNSKEISEFENLDESYININYLTENELQDDEYYMSKFKKDGDEIISYKNSRRKLTNFLDTKNNFIPDLPVITYYSYKGGMGRSTNLVITATYLARHYDKKVVIIDCDFEAPGFSNFFLEDPTEPRYQNGLMEYLFDKEIKESSNLDDYSWEVSKKYSKNGEIRIIPAGNLDTKTNLSNNIFKTNLSHYLEGLARLDMSSTESIVDKFKNLIIDIKNQYSPDLIFIDSRTGFTDIFGITALKLSTQIVGFFSNSIQNEPGLYQFTKSIQNLIHSKPDLNPPLIINSFSDSTFFNEFKEKADNIIRTNNNNNNNVFELSPFYYYFRNNSTLSEIGTKRENSDEWLEQIDEKSFSKGYSDVAEKINSFIFTKKSDINVNIVNDNDDKKSFAKLDVITSPSSDNLRVNNIQNTILVNLKKNWPDLYADSENVDYQKEFDEKRIFYRESMRDIFNMKKFIILGNKGTGKSYIFQSLKNKDITNELKRQSQKNNLNVHFLHLVDKKENYFINTNFFDSFKEEITEIGDFYSKFWKVYTWKSITDKICNVIDYKTSLDVDFKIINNDTENSLKIINFIKNLDNIISIENELREIDNKLNSAQIDVIVIYDNLDLMVDPIKWKNEMFSLIDYWQYSNFKRIHSKLFLRSDLYKTIRGINNINSLSNNIISIEWQKEEIFNYFFNFVKQYCKNEFISSVENYDFKRVSSDAIEWIMDFKQKFKNEEKQYQFDESILRKLCWVFFGKYPDIKAHGESYDWLYKNVMNADETISIRPFLDLLSLSIDEFFKDNSKDNSAILPEKYYTAKPVRSKAVEKHFKDLVTEKGNENLESIFEFIDKNSEYQYYQLERNNLYEMLQKVIDKNKLESVTVEDLEDLLIINGILKQIGNLKYSFAFLYKYRLGLKNKNKNKNKSKSRF